MPKPTYGTTQTLTLQGGPGGYVVFDAAVDPRPVAKNTVAMFYIWPHGDKDAQKAAADRAVRFMRGEQVQWTAPTTEEGG